MSELSEQEIRRIAEQAIEQLGEDASPQAVEKVVKETVHRIERQANDPNIKRETETKNVAHTKKQSNNRIIVTAFGKNQKGILAGLTGTLAKHSCDIIDLSQKILQEFFTIMLLVDIAQCTIDFEELKDSLIEAGKKFDLKVVIQHEEIFNIMHRV
ncbi:MAG: ACT domain-containing protein [Caldithrix sp.]|nr:ACT domain-containing protein [Caldithrix sp.]